MPNLIVMIHPHLDLRGGAERKFLLIYNELVNSGHNVEIITGSYDKDKTFYELIEANIEVKIVVAKYKFIWFVKVFLEIIKNKYTIVVASNYPANIPVTIAKFFNRKLKTVWILNEIAVKLIRKNNFVWGVYYKLEAKMNSYFDKIIVNSFFTSNEVVNYYNFNPLVVYSGVEVKESIDKLNISNNLLRICDEVFIFCLSRLELHKNILFLDELSKNFSKIKIVVAGSGHDEEKVKLLDNKHQNLFYVGMVNEDEKFFLMKNARVFLFLPHNEPLGVTVLEAISQNTPVVAFNSGGPKETILDKVNGFLSDSESHYLSNIEFILENEFTVNIENGKKYIDDKFSNKRMQGDFMKAITLWD